MTTEKKRVFDFRTQLQLGDRAEELFLQHYHEPLIFHTTLKADFQVVNTGELLELKTDTYNMEKTPNFFWERWSDFHNKKPGGPWQSRRNRVSRYCYMFSRHNTYFEFSDMKRLIGRLNKAIKGKYGITVKNKGWLTVGFPLPRLDFEDLYVQHTFTHSSEDSQEYSIFSGSSFPSPSRVSAIDTLDEPEQAS